MDNPKTEQVQQDLLESLYSQMIEELICLRDILASLLMDHRAYISNEDPMLALKMLKAFAMSTSTMRTMKNVQEMGFLDG